MGVGGGVSLTHNASTPSETSTLSRKGQRTLQQYSATPPPLHPVLWWRNSSQFSILHTSGTLCHCSVITTMSALAAPTVSSSTLFANDITFERRKEKAVPNRRHFIEIILLRFFTLFPPDGSMHRYRAHSVLAVPRATAITVSDFFSRSITALGG